jgi:TRAP-type C4-dicarboxylate transport system permease small subunit
MISLLAEADRWLGRFEMLLSVLLLILLVAITAAGVFFRYVLASPFGWGVDLAVVSLVWLTFVGAASVYRQDAHIAASSLSSALPQPLSGLLVLVLIAVTGVSMAVLVWFGWGMAQVQHRQTITGLGIPRSFYSIPVVWFGLSVCLHLVVRLLTRGLQAGAGRGDA